MQELKKYLVVFGGDHFQFTMDLLLAVETSIVQTNHFENKKNPETWGKVFSFATINYTYWLSYHKTQNQM